ncbi:hypothetical protein [Vibrio hangzhouensis]|uniref:Transporter suffix domain-containing protein n=1 Tax=Vibrio hangzhouensis TaxID=462991 RepID=A0A1H6BXN1_9VIBR|nr:hypothetical protein [Vibrio hangzhouensis]SEG52564.1 hypothetical protein SAMN04488244_11793 [Vibrio hangzhouensis]SEG65217.1 hypothetical protein SAMN04488244_1278 [Vibrio hangzhouensis]
MKRCIQTIWSTVSHNLRFILGISAFAMALMSPLLIPVITTLDICGSKKALLSGAMIFGVPEVATIAAIFLLGRERLQRFKIWLLETLFKLKPSRRSTRRLYYTGLGLMMLVGPIMNVILFYLPGYFPEWIGYRQWLGISCDVIFVVALFIAGEQLWGKIEAIFRFDEVSPVQG